MFHLLTFIILLSREILKEKLWVAVNFHEIKSFYFQTKIICNIPHLFQKLLFKNKTPEQMRYRKSKQNKTKQQTNEQVYK